MKMIKKLILFLAALLVFSCSLFVASNSESKTLSAGTNESIDSRGLYDQRRDPSRTPPNTPDGQTILPSEAPMFVIFGYDDNQFDDGMHNILNLYKTRTNPVGSGNPYTFDGTPTKASFYLTVEGRNATSSWMVEQVTIDSWKRAYDEKHEVGNHTWYHENGGGYDNARWTEEISKVTDFLVDRIGMNRADMKGFRAPFLIYNTTLHTVLKQQGLLYDTSFEGGGWAGEKGTKNYWPYTMDGGTPPGESGRPLGVVPGLWELPLDNVYNSSGSSTQGLDYNIWFKRKTKAEFLDYLKTSFLKKYNGNRAPFHFGMHTNYYSDKAVKDWELWSPQNLTMLNSTVTDRLSAVEEFLDWVLQYQEVRVVSAQQALQWLKSPVKLGVVTEHNVTVTAGPNGYVSKKGAFKVPNGHNFTLEVDPDPGYIVEEAKVNNSPVVVEPGEYTISNIIQDTTFNITFLRDENIIVRTVTASSGANGKFVKEGPLKVEDGDSLVLDVEPDDGYVVANFKVDNVTIPNPVFPYTLTNVTKDMPVYVDFVYVGSEHRMTFFWTYNPEDQPVTPEGKMVDLKNTDEEVIATVDLALAKKISMEGSGFLPKPDGRLINLAKNADWPDARFFVVDTSISPWGFDSQGGPLVPWVSVAVDPEVIPLNSDLYIEVFDGVQLPQGASLPDGSTIHNGWFKAVDTSHSFKGKWVDIFAAKHGDYETMSARLGHISNPIVKVSAGVEYTITPTSGENGGMWPNTPQKVAEGFDRPFTFYPAPDYKIDKVTLNGDQVQPNENNIYLVRNVQADADLHVTFVKDEVRYFDVTSSAGQNGTVSHPNDRVKEGTDVVFTITPDDQYKVLTAKLNGNDVLNDIVQNKYTHVNVKENLDFQVTFVYDPIPQFTVTATASSNGTVTPDSVTVNEGGDAVFTIIPADGYIVEYAKLDGTDVKSSIVDNKLTITDIRDNKTLDVKFKLKPDTPLIVEYKKGPDWNTGFGANVFITNEGTEAVSSWKVTMTFTGNQQISGWNGIFNQVGQVVTVTNTSWNGTIQPGETVSFGFNGSYSGTNPDPEVKVE